MGKTIKIDVDNLSHQKEEKPKDDFAERNSKKYRI